MKCDRCGGAMKPGNTADGGTIVRERGRDGKVRSFFAALCQKCLDVAFPKGHNAQVAQGAAGTEGKERKGKGAGWLGNVRRRLAGR